MCNYTTLTDNFLKYLKKKNRDEKIFFCSNCGGHWKRVKVKIEL